MLKEGATPYHMACAVCDDLNFRLVQQFYRKHREYEEVTDCKQSITGLSIIFSRPIDTAQFERDLLCDIDLLRYAI